MNPVEKVRVGTVMTAMLVVRLRAIQILRGRLARANGLPKLISRGRCRSAAARRRASSSLELTVSLSEIILANDEPVKSLQPVIC